MLILALLAGCEPYDARAPFISCISERVDSSGTVVTTTYDLWGWPTVEETVVPESPPFVAETEYSRVAGRVVESLTLLNGGPESVTRLYDGHEHLTSYSTNGSNPDADYECTWTHKGELGTQSNCTNQVNTAYDDCGNPDRVVFSGGEESWGHTYQGCQVINGQILGNDDAGSYSENFQHSLGREVSRVRDRGGVLTSTFTTWQCPSDAL